MGMPMTPVEIRNHRFRKGMRGYNDQEVNNFLILVAEEYETLYQENAELKESIQKYEFELIKYKKMEETLKQSLVLAQQTAEELKANARVEADLILKEARQRVAEIFLVYEDILKRLAVFKSEIKSFMMSQIELMEKSEKKIDDIVGFFNSQDTRQIMNNLQAIGEEEKARTGTGG